MDAKPEIPEGAIRAAKEIIAYAVEFHGERPAQMDGDAIAEAALLVAYPAMRVQWEREQLEAMRSDETSRRLAYLVSGVSHNQAHCRDIARQIVDYLTTLQVKVSPDAQS